MEKYNYKKEIVQDVKSYLFENITEMMADVPFEDLEEHLNDLLWTDDSVTGNGSGSYTFSRWEAEENLCHNLGLLQEAVDEFGTVDMFDPEACDVTIRCYLLSQCIAEVLQEFESYKDIINQ